MSTDEKPATKADIDRLIRRTNEITKDTKANITDLNSAYKERIKYLGQPVSITEQLKALKDIDETFAVIEERNKKDAKEFLDDLNKREEEHIEIGLKMKKLQVEDAP